ncbi:MAG: nucleoside hydrolase [bacterium]|nr:nucleoside hydrolase [bacterium]
MSKAIILDTDPGHDDAFAIFMAIASSEALDLQAITTVAGNVPLDKTTYNALRLRELIGATDVPIYRGCSRPMVNELVTAEHVHGETGLDGPQLPEPTKGTESTHAVDYMIDRLLAAEDRSTTVCLIGPLTNMGMALVKEPSIAAKINEIVIMGGSFKEGGNITPTAEFNVYVDPHAAHVVLTSGVPITIMPLDVTHQAQATPPRVAEIRSLGAPLGEVVGAMLDFVEQFDLSHYGFAGFPLHDPTVIAYLLEPEIFQPRPAYVSVVTDAGDTHGQTVADWYGLTGREPNAQVMMSLDADRFFALLTERLSRIASPQPDPTETGQAPRR